MTVPDAVTAPAPITERAWITQRWPTMAPGPTTEPSTVALDATRVEGIAAGLRQHYGDPEGALEFLNRAYQETSPGETGTRVH